MGLITDTSDYLLPYNYAASDAPALNALIEAVSTLIQKYCNRNFLSATYTELLDGTGTNQIFVKNPPIITLTSITFLAATNVTPVVTDFVYKPTGEIRWNTYNLTSSDIVGYFPEGYQNIQIVYTGGFATVPTPIQLACAQIVGDLFSPDGNLEAIEFLKLGQYSASYNDKIEKTVFGKRKILELYKLRYI